MKHTCQTCIHYILSKKFCPKKNQNVVNITKHRESCATLWEPMTVVVERLAHDTTNVKESINIELEVAQTDSDSQLDSQRKQSTILSRLFHRRG